MRIPRRLKKKLKRDPYRIWIKNRFAKRLIELSNNFIFEYVIKEDLKLISKPINYVELANKLVIKEDWPEGIPIIFDK